MDKPTIIIGLGGSGTRIAETVWQNASQQQKNSMPFFCMDSEKNCIENLREKTPSVHAVDLCERLRFQDCLSLEGGAGYDWFPMHPVLRIDPWSLRYLRAAGRLSFHMAVRRGKLQMPDSILKDLCQADQKIQVILTGSLCGYTGSALILPLSLYIRDYVKTELPGTSVRITGFFLLPEAFDTVVRSSKEHDDLKVNAYAVMREINAFSLADAGCLPDTYDFSLSIPCFGSDRTKELSGRPLDRCFLFSGRNGNGLQLRTFTDCTDYAADCILSALSGTDRDLTAAFDDPESVFKPEHLRHYSMAYHDAVRQLERSGISRAFITPHLDRRWHDPAVMPDPDDIA